MPEPGSTIGVTQWRESNFKPFLNPVDGNSNQPVRVEPPGPPGPGRLFLDSSPLFLPCLHYSLNKHTHTHKISLSGLVDENCQIKRKNGTESEVCKHEACQGERKREIMAEGKPSGGKKINAK